QIVVETMHVRKLKMLEMADAVVALPGGCGTFEELLEAITWKRLGLFFGPIIIVNTRDYYAPLVAMLERAVDERFMNETHRSMWNLVDRPEDILPVIDATPDWDRKARDYAAVK
ncbi:MAG: TIGR00730 family Rossman fold protein, partial [Verrucomicrobiota bacterium]